VGGQGNESAKKKKPEEETSGKKLGKWEGGGKIKKLKGA